MKKMFSLLWTCAVCAATLICAPGSLAQGSGQVDLQFASQETKLIGPSPEAAAMTRYADYLVSYALGQAEVSIPLYEIKSRSLTLPITLQYNTSGVRVDEISGIAGLNWTLQAGGVITRTVVGIPDESSYYGWDDALDIYSGDPPVMDWDGVHKFDELASGERDSGRDAYSYSFPGGSGTFFLSRTASGVRVVPTTATDLVIEYVPGPGGVSFRITDPSGTVWTFAETETTSRQTEMVQTLAGSGEGNPDWAQQYASPVTAWYLTEIGSMDGTDAITLEYQTLPVLNTVSLSHVRNYSFTHWTQPTNQFLETPGGPTGGSWGACPLVSYDSGAYRTQRWWSPKVVDRISWAGGRADFTYTASTIQAAGNIRRSYPSYLSSIVIRTVPVGSTGDGTVERTVSLTMGTTLDQRHLLKGVTVTGRSAGSAIESYQMTYLSESSANMIQSAKDLFGYYNAATSNQNTAFLRLFDDIYAFNEPVANRGYNAVAASALSLETITTGSGAKTKFYYAGNSVSLSGASDLWTTVGIGHRISRIETYDLSGGGSDGTLVRRRDFTYESPRLTVPQEAFRRSAFVSVSESLDEGQPEFAFAEGMDGVPRRTVVSFSDQSTLPGAGPESARIAYGTVTETVSGPDGSGEQYKTEYTYDLSVVTALSSGGSWGYTDERRIHDEHMDAPHAPYGLWHFFQRPPSQVGRVDGSPSVIFTPRWNHFDERERPELSMPTRVRRYKHQGGTDVLIGQTVNEYDRAEEDLRTGWQVRNMIARGSDGSTLDTLCAMDFYKDEVKYRRVWQRLDRTTETEWLDDGISTRTVETSYVYDKGSRASFTGTAGDNGGAAAVTYPLPPTDPTSQIPVPPMGSILSPRLVTQVFDGDPDRVYSRYSIFPDELAAADSAAGTNAYVWASQLLNLGYRQAVGEEVLVGGGGLHGNGHVAMIGVPASKSGRYVTWSSFTPADTNTGSLLKPSKVEVWRQEAGDPAGYVNVGPTVQYTRYDHWGNPLEVQQQGQPTRTYLWGYGGLRPVAEIAPIGYAQTRSIISPSNVDALASAGNGPTDAQFTQIRSSLATAYSSSQVSLYTYSIPFGISSVEDPSGRKTIYEYDGAGRLTAVKDEDDNLMEGYLYELTRGGNGTPNRIVSLSYTGSGTLSAPSSFNAAMGASDAMKEVVYLDGLGRTKQGVSVGAATDGQDLVTPSVPDFLDREDARVYLPYPAATSSNNSGSYRTGALAAQQSYYNGLYGSPAEPTVKAYSENVYELSSRNRVTATSLPGFAERTTMQLDKSPADTLLLLSFDTDSQTISASGYYGVNRFTVSVTSGPDGSVTESWTDEFGTPVLERVLIEEADSNAGQTAPRWAETRYVKDIRGRVVCVIPPAEYALLSNQASNSNGIVASFSAEHCYTYAYDGRDRVVSRHLPDQATESLTYNQADLVLTTARMAADSIAVETFSTEYDAFNRPVQEKYQYGNGPAIILSEYAYDAYPTTMGTGTAVQAVPEFSAVSGIAETADKDPRVKGLKTAERVRILPAEESAAAMAADADAKYIVRSFHYDRKGNVIQTAESRPDESGASGSTVLRTSTKYGFQGNVLQTRESVQLPPSGGVVPSPTHLDKSYSYDVRLRPAVQTAQLTHNGISGAEALLRYTYDDLGRTATLIRGTGVKADTTAYSYTLQGWLAEAEGGTYSETLHYQDTTRAATSGLPGKAGLVTEWTTWQKGLSTNGATTLSDTYAYSYDKAGRLLGSVRYSGSSATPLSTLTESGISYDDSGNLTAIKRYGESSGTEPVDDLAFSYTGTRRTGYSYDAHGNVTQDPTNGTILEWNILGLPRTISDGTDTARRVYAADGTLLAVYGGTTGTVGDLYLGSSIYERKASGTVSLESAGWEGGRILPGIGTDNLIYQITDHLGSVRAIRRGNGTVERRFDYYPFGSESRHWAWSGQQPFPKTQAGGDAIPKGGGFDFDFEPIILGARAATSRWRFGGKEIAGQKVGASVSQNGTPGAPAGTPAATAGRPYLDFGARLYDPRTAAWLSQDPMAEKYYGFSPYAYCAGNPVNIVDPTGLYFTESGLSFAKTLIDETLRQISALYNKISNANLQLEQGNISTKKEKQIRKNIEKYEAQIAEYNTVFDEIALLAGSNQCYDIIYDASLNQFDSFGNGDVYGLTEYDFDSNSVKIKLGDYSMGLLAHELKHAHQFEIGAYSVGYMGGGPFYDKGDEWEAYRRGALFGNHLPYSLDKRYDNYPDGPLDYNTVLQIRLAADNPTILEAIAIKYKKVAFRVNGKTYVSNHE